MRRGATANRAPGRGRTNGRSNNRSGRGPQRNGPQSIGRSNNNGRYNNNGRTNMFCTKQWLDSIQDCTACLREYGDCDNDTVMNALNYLSTLQGILYEKEQYWDQPPKNRPPSFRQNVEAFDLNDNNDNNDNSEHKPSRLAVNPYYVDGYNSDDDDNDARDEDGGDTITYSFIGAGDMSMRRILIRVLNSMSELHAALARNTRRSNKWLEGSDNLENSLALIHRALNLADEEIARYWQIHDQTDYNNSRNNNYILERQELEKDADFVEIAISALTDEREQLLRKLQKLQRSLEHKLEPQWQSRDEVKQNWGDDRWTSNPSPKQDYARIRAAQERELRNVRKALQVLQMMDIDAIMNKARFSRNKLTSRQATEVNSDDVITTTAEKQRYNGARPTDYSKRVPWATYPDPADFGWTFTGSHDNIVEFFERQDNSNDAGALVKLDWFFTTATVKTALDHPRQGRTQLFGKSVSSDMYKKVMVNPREHTGTRYKKKKQQNK